jgi:hypothetical protein
MLAAACEPHPRGGDLHAPTDAFIAAARARAANPRWKALVECALFLQRARNATATARVLLDEAMQAGPHPRPRPCEGVRADGRRARQEAPGEAGPLLASGWFDLEARGDPPAVRAPPAPRAPRPAPRTPRLPPRGSDAARAARAALAGREPTSGAGAQAEEQLSRAVREHPRAADAVRVLACLRQRQGRAAEAERLLMRAVWLSTTANKDPCSAAALCDLGHLLGSSGRIAEAEQRFRQATDADAALPEPCVGLAACLLVQRSRPAPAPRAGGCSRRAR